MSLEYAVTIFSWEFCVLVNSERVFLAFKPDHLWMKLPWRKGVSGVSFVGGGMRILLRREKKSLINCTFNDPLTSWLGTRQPR